jgi:hypothetical protein
MKLRNPILFAVILFSVFLSACVSTSTLKKNINNKIEGKTNQTELFNSDFLKLEADSLLFSDNEVIVKRISSYFIPLIVYWGWKGTSECKVSNRYFVNLFNEVLSKKNTDFPYQKHLASKKLILELTSVPTTFYYTNKSTYILIPQFLGAGIYYSSENIYPENQQLSIRYRLISENVIIKQGVKHLDFKNPVSSILNPSILGIENYLDNMKTEFEFQSSLLIDNIIDDL